MVCIAVLCLLPLVASLRVDELPQRAGIRRHTPDSAAHRFEGQHAVHGWPDWPRWPPDIDGLVVNKGYPFQAHWVTTCDGYKLQVFRLPTYRPGHAAAQPVLLMHGLLVRC